jgi:hypothetical protein
MTPGATALTRCPSLRTDHQRFRGAFNRLCQQARTDGNAAVGVVDEAGRDCTMCPEPRFSIGRDELGDMEEASRLTRAIEA